LIVAASVFFWNAAIKYVTSRPGGKKTKNIQRCSFAYEQEGEKKRLIFFLLGILVEQTNMIEPYTYLASSCRL